MRLGVRIADARVVGQEQESARSDERDVRRVSLPMLAGAIWSAAVAAALVFFCFCLGKRRKQSKAAETAALQSRPPPCRFPTSGGTPRSARRIFFLEVPYVLCAAVVVRGSQTAAARAKAPANSRAITTVQDGIHQSLAWNQSASPTGEAMG